MSDRSPSEIASRAAFPIVLGGQVYPLRPLVIAQNKVWCAKFATALSTAWASVPNLADLSALIEMATHLSTDVMIGLLLDYDAEHRLPATQELIENSADPDEVWSAFKTVIGHAFPFLADALRSPQGLQMAMNSLSERRMN